MELICPHCGGAIVVATVAQPVAQLSLDARIAHVSKTLSTNQSSKTEKPYNTGYNAQFLEFWEVYPLHRDKRKAEKAWRNAVARAGATADARAAIIAGAIRYRDDPNRSNEFTKYAEGWLNGDGWEDEPLPPRLSNGKSPMVGSREWAEGVAKRG